MASAIENREIEALAKAIGINTKLDRLGLNLGYEYEAIEVFKANNYSGGRVTCQGTKEMLKDWRNDTPVEQQRPILKKALEEAGLVRLAEQHLGGQQSGTQTQKGVTNTITASESSTVSGNTMIGQQTNNVYNNSPPSAPTVHHHNTTVVQAPPVSMPVYIPHTQAPKRQAIPIPGPAPKRQKVSQGGPSTSKAKSSKPKKSATSNRNSTTKSSDKKLHTTKKPATPKTSKKKAPKTQKAPKAPTKKAPKKPDTKKKSPQKKRKVTKQKPPKTKQSKIQKSKTSGRVRPQKKPKKSKKK